MLTSGGEAFSMGQNPYQAPSIPQSRHRVPLGWQIISIVGGIAGSVVVGCCAGFAFCVKLLDLMVRIEQRRLPGRRIVDEDDLSTWHRDVAMWSGLAVWVAVTIALSVISIVIARVYLKRSVADRIN